MKESIIATAFRLKCPPIPTVRIALVGLGNRGIKTLIRYAYIPHAEIRYIVDVDEEKLNQANELLHKSGRMEAEKLCGTNAWREACEKKDVDLIYICTKWQSHAEMSVYAMRNGKHVAVEVPAATTVEECWDLVRTAEETQRHCFMTENCCYDIFALETLEMHRQGCLGKLTHCEGAYIHDLTTGDGNWIEQSCLHHGGNPYPTHGIGPIAQLLGFHRQDRMRKLVSMTSATFHHGKTAKGGVNTTLIQTEKGVSIMLQLDVTTHRPYSRMQTVCGTEAFVQKYPMPTVQVGAACLTGKAAMEYMHRFASSEAAALWLQGEEMKVPNPMNYAMDFRLIDCLHKGLPLDIDVYDAAEWSCLVELTQQSAMAGGVPVDIPDFMAHH